MSLPEVSRPSVSSDRMIGFAPAAPVTTVTVACFVAGDWLGGLQYQQGPGVL